MVLSVRKTRFNFLQTSTLLSLLLGHWRGGDRTSGRAPGGVGVVVETVEGYLSLGRRRPLDLNLGHETIEPLITINRIVKKDVNSTPPPTPPP